jgi:rhodanese-related sulfurtransferase
MMGYVMMRQISVLEAAKRLQAGAVLVDVREAEEFAGIAAPGAVLVPLSRIQREGLAAFDNNAIDPHQSDLLVICRSGGRSAMVCEALGDQAINVEGGMLAWEAAGLPTI